MAAILLIILAVTTLVTAVIEGRSRRDVEVRSCPLFRSIGDRVVDAIGSGDASSITPLFERVTGDDRLVALGFCDKAGDLRYAAEQMPPNLKCNQLPPGNGVSFTTIRAPQGRLSSSVHRAADVCIVSSLHDGMNLVAKEFIASRDNEQGVLVLSSFAGASRELSNALIVNH